MTKKAKKYWVRSLVDGWMDRGEIIHDLMAGSEHGERLTKTSVLFSRLFASLIARKGSWPMGEERRAATARSDWSMGGA